MTILTIRKKHDLQGKAVQFMDDGKFPPTLPSVLDLISYAQERLTNVDVVLEYEFAKGDDTDKIRITQTNPSGEKISFSLCHGDYLVYFGRALFPMLAHTFDETYEESK